MKKSKLHLQMNLSKFSEMKIKELYKIPQDQKVELAIWAGKAFDADIREKGFVFTNSAMYWNFPTSGETAEGTNFVAKEAVLKSVETGANEIAVSTDSKDIKFTLNEKFTSDDAAFIKAVISSYYTDYKLTKTFAADIVAKDENNSIVFTYLMTSDFFTEGVAGVKNKFAKKEKSKDIQTSSETSSTSTETTSASDTDANSNADSSSNGTATESKKEKKAKSKKEKTSEDKPKVGFFTKFGHFWRHILDVIVDLILILGIVLLLKPDLFPKNEAVVLEVPEIQEQVKLNDSVDNQIDIEVDKIEPALIEKPADIIEPASNTAPSSEEAILIPEEPAVKPVSET
ncbi:MAG: hypothetical protein K6G52_01765, partial [Treponemataceae bacterium]|nr:hypothetical protein [Treponemataceae bacterium]